MLVPERKIQFRGTKCNPTKKIYRKTSHQNRFITHLSYVLERLIKLADTHKRILIHRNVFLILPPFTLTPSNLNNSIDYINLQNRNNWIILAFFFPASNAKNHHRHSSNKRPRGKSKLLQPITENNFASTFSNYHHCIEWGTNKVGTAATISHNFNFKPPSLLYVPPSVSKVNWSPQ